MAPSPLEITQGGSSNKGILFALTPGDSPGGAWSETILHDSAGRSDGASPHRPTCSLGGNGAIYSTSGSGALGYGTVLELTGLVLPY